MHNLLQTALRKSLSCVLLICRKSDKLDWMYQGGMVAKAEANKRVEEQQQQAAQPEQPSNVSACALPVQIIALQGLPHAVRTVI